jgi:hypothetical protein
MFEQPVGKAEKDRSRTIIVASGLAVLIVILLIVLVSWVGTRTRQGAEFSPAGTAEFDDYAGFLRLEGLNIREGERLNNNYVRFLCAVRNTGDQTLVGLQLRGVCKGFTGEVLKEKIFTPIPNQRDTLGQNQAMDLDLYIEPTPAASEIGEMTLEISAIKLK